MYSLMTNVVGVLIPFPCVTEFWIQNLGDRGLFFEHKREELKGGSFSIKRTWRSYNLRIIYIIKFRVKYVFGPLNFTENWNSSLFEILDQFSPLSLKNAWI